MLKIYEALIHMQLQWFKKYSINDQKTEQGPKKCRTVVNVREFLIYLFIYFS